MIGIDAMARLTAGILDLGFREVYEVGGAVRDRLLGNRPHDFDYVVCGHDADQLLAVARQAGTVAPLSVAGTLIGVRLTASWTNPEGVEIALARTEASTGPSRHQFAIRTGPDISLLQDLRRRDFTANAIARNVETGELIDPFGGADDIASRVLRTISDTSLQEDPLRVFRALTRIAADGFRLAPETETQIRAWAQNPAAELIRLAPELIAEHTASRREDALTAHFKSIARDDWTEEVARLALTANGQALLGQLTGYRWYGGMPISPERVYQELVKILSGRRAALALTVARDTGVMAHLLPEFGPAIGFDQMSGYHDLTVDEHTLSAVQHAAEHGYPLTVRLAALLHDLGKSGDPVTGEQTAWGWVRGSNSEFPVYRDEFIATPGSGRVTGRLHFYARPAHGGQLPGRPHEALSADLAARALARLGAERALSDTVVRLVAQHMFTEDAGCAALSDQAAARRARRFLVRVGRGDAVDLLKLRRCDRAAKRANLEPGWDTDINAFEAAVSRESHASAVSVKELAIDGHDLIGLGLNGKEIGVTLQLLLARVVEDGALNTRERLLQIARGDTP